VRRREANQLVKILVISDSHGNKGAIRKAVDLEVPGIILHLGDHDSDCKTIEPEYPDIPFRCVRGNCDRSSTGADTDEFTLGGKRFYMTHGHLQRVKIGLSPVLKAASCRGADVLLFGHTHVPYYSVKENVTVVNPGSIGMGGKTYAVLEFKNGAVVCNIKSV